MTTLRTSQPPADRVSHGLIELVRVSERAPAQARSRDSLADVFLGLGVPPSLTPSAPPAPLDGREKAMFVVALAAIAVAFATSGLAVWALTDRGDEPRVVITESARAGAVVSPEPATPPEVATAPTAPAEVEPIGEPVEAEPVEAEPAPTRPTPVARPRPTPRATPAPTTPATDEPTDPDSIDALLERALSGGSTTEVPEHTYPELPSRERVLSILRGASNEVGECAAGGEGIATVALTINGPTGRVTRAAVSGASAGTPVAACITQRLRDVRFPRFERESFQVTFPYRL